MADNWRVVAQRQTSDITPDGRFQEVMEVTVEVLGGTTITVRIPIDQYDAALANQIIADRVAQVVAVADL